LTPFVVGEEGGGDEEDDEDGDEDLHGEPRRTGQGYHFGIWTNVLSGFG
jgi:hypothetical protein